MEILLFLLLFPISKAFAAGADRESEIKLLLKSPDASLSGTYDLPASAPLIEGLLRSPLLLAHLWEAYDFSPHYKVRMQGDAIHVDDPTGIQGDIFPVEQSPGRWVYYGTGALNHKLVPAFRGKMAVVFNMIPKGSGMNTRVDVHIRAENRFLGFLASTLFPLVKTRAVNRMTLNVHDFCAILSDLSTAPQKAATKLKNKEDAAALHKLIPPGADTKDATTSKVAPPKPTMQTKTAKKD